MIHKQTEEGFKFQKLKNDPYYVDRVVDGVMTSWRPNKYDLISPQNDMIVEFKRNDDLSPEQVIFQAIVTAVVDRRSFNWYGSHTPEHRKCVPAYCIDTRWIALEDLTPSKRDEKHKLVFSYFKKAISENMIDFPSHDERLKVIKARELHNKMTDEEFDRLKNQISILPTESDFILETENWRISTEDREKHNAFYTPSYVAEQVKNLVLKHWEFEQIWDCAAGDGHLVSWFDNTVLSDINSGTVIHNGIIQDYMKLKTPISHFDKKNGIIIVNPSYNKKHIRHLISFAENNKLRMCIFGPASYFPTDKQLPIVDGFFSPGWGNGGEGRKERGQIIVLFDFTGNTPNLDKITFSDGTRFECRPDAGAIETKKGFLRYGCTANESMAVASETDINMFATCSSHIDVIGCFLSSKIKNYITDHNGQGGRHGYGKWIRKKS